MKHKILLLIILIIAICSANFKFDNTKIIIPEINKIFPHQIGNWTSRDYKAGKSVYRMIDQSELLLRLYKNKITGQAATVAIVLTDKRDHIHEPESCYELQGIAIYKETVVKISSKDSIIYAQAKRQQKPYDIYLWYTDLNKNYTSRAEFIKHMAISKFFNKPINGYGLVVIMSPKYDNSQTFSFAKSINEIILEMNKNL